MTPLSPFEAQWPAISSLLDEALNLAAHERAPWLEGLAGEASLHRETLRTLLAHQAKVETDDFLNALPALDFAVAEPSMRGPCAGDVVGAYRLIEQIGQGGMGTVWLAGRTDRLMNRRVALKLPRIVWGEAFAERLAREQEILATLEHEHIARLYDAGIDAHGRPFLAMEYVEGEPLDAYLCTHALSIRERVLLLLQVMAAVSHAHARLVVHRDLKPGNILVTADAKVKLLDFGIAKLLEGDSTKGTALTELSGRALTLDYASPEQIRAEALGTASDVYSLGVVAYEVLAGVRPYRLKRGTAAEIEEAIASIEAPLASSRAANHVVAKQLRGDLDAILNRALKKAGVDRYPSIEAFAQELQRHLRGEPVQARPDSLHYRVGRFIVRHRLAAVMASAVLTSVIVGGAASAWQWRLARDGERRATTELERQRAIQDLYIETFSRLSVLGAEHPEELVKPGAVTSQLVRKLAELEPRFAKRPEERGAQLWATMLQLNYDNRFAESLAVGEEYLATLKAHGSTAERIISVYTALGRTLAQLKRLDESETMRRAGMNWPSDAHDLDTEIARMQVSTDLGNLLTVRGKRDEALAVLTRADASVARLYAHEHLRFENLTALALLYLGFDDVKALTYMQQARDELLANGTTSPDRQSQLALHLGKVLVANGQLEEAERSLTDAVSIIRREYGRASRNALVAFGELASAVSRRDPARAASMIEQERHTLESSATGLSASGDLQLHALQISNGWIAGDTAALGAVKLLDEERLLDPTALRGNEFLLIQLVRAKLQSGSAAEGLRLMQKVASLWPDRNLPTISWLRIQETLAEAQIEAGQPTAAGKTAADLMQLLEMQHAVAGRAYRVGASLGALAAVRRGDRDAATRLLDRMAKASPPFPSPVERADCELRRAEVLISLGRVQEGATVASSALHELQGQHPGSPRVALAQRLMERAAK